MSSMILLNKKYMKHKYKEEEVSKAGDSKSIQNMHRFEI